VHRHVLYTRPQSGSHSHPSIVSRLTGLDAHSQNSQWELRVKVNCIIGVDTGEEPHRVPGSESQFYNTDVKEGIKKIIEH